MSNPPEKAAMGKLSAEEIEINRRALKSFLGKFPQAPGSFELACSDIDALCDLALSALDRWQATVALRELVQERDEARKYWTLYFDECIESDTQRMALSRSLTQHKDWLREALAGCEDFWLVQAPSRSRIAQIRKLMERQ